MNRFSGEEKSKKQPPGKLCSWRLTRFCRWLCGHQKAVSVFILGFSPFRGTDRDAGLRLTVDDFAHFLAGLEVHGILRRDFNALTGAGIAALALGTLAGLEGAKADQRDLVARVISSRISRTASSAVFAEMPGIRSLRRSISSERVTAAIY